jgi:hypothetical protein
LNSELVTFPATPETARFGGLRLRTSEPEALAVAEPVAAPAPVEVTPVSQSGGGADPTVYRDPHLELADLLLAHETF